MKEPECSSSYIDTAIRLGQLVTDKQQQYGDSISGMGSLLAVLYPNGIKLEQYNDLGLVIRILDKISRITKGNGEGNEDAWNDIAGYGLLGSVNRQNREKCSEYAWDRKANRIVKIYDSTEDI